MDAMDAMDGHGYAGHSLLQSPLPGASPKTHLRTGFAPSPLKPSTIQDYCWQNEDAFVRVYVSLKGVHLLPKTCVRSTFSKDSFTITVDAFHEGISYRLAIKDLYGTINPTECRHVVQKDKVTIILVKAMDGKSDGPNTNVFTWFSLRL